MAVDIISCWIMIWSLNSKLLHTNTHVVFLKNAVCVLLHVTLCKNVNFSLLHQFSFWQLGILLCITLVFCSFLSISNFIPLLLLAFQSCFIRCRLIYFNAGSKIGDFNNRSSFSRCTIFLDFSITSLFKLLIKFLCCIMSILLILLLHILTVTTFCKAVICIYSRHILYFSLLTNYLC